MSTHISPKDADFLREMNKKETTAIREDTGKVRLDLISPIATIGTAQVLTYGASKYPLHNWRKGLQWSRCIGSLMRHLFKFMAGEDFDQETGLPHIDHVASNAMFLQEYFRTHKELDDRYNTELKENGV